MARARTGISRTLERWSPTLFLIGGALVVGHAAVRGIEAFTDLAPPPDVFGPPGYLLALAGLLGLYPALVARTPRLVRVAAGVATVPLAGWAVLTAGTLAEALGLLTLAAVLPGAVYVVHLTILILTYTLFAVATLRAGVHTRGLGLLLLVPPLLMGALLVGAVTMANPVVGAFVIGSGQAAVHLAIGGILRTRAPSDSLAPANDATAG